MFFLPFLVRLLHRRSRARGTVLAFIMQRGRIGTARGTSMKPRSDRLGDPGVVLHEGETMKALTTGVIGFALLALLAPLLDAWLRQR